MRINTSLKFTGISSNLNEAIGDIGFLYDEFLEEAQKLLEHGFMRTEPIQEAFKNYVDYSKGVEKRLKGTSAENYAKSLVNFRQNKEEILSHILGKYREGVIPAILGLKLGTQIFKYTDSIKNNSSVPGIIKSFLERIKGIFKQK